MGYSTAMENTTHNGHFADRDDVFPCRARTTTKLASRMSRIELARVVAEHRGLVTSSGGWLYTPNGRPVCHGYAAFARMLGDALVEGRGIDWRRITLPHYDLAPRAGRRA